MKASTRRYFSLIHFKPVVYSRLCLVWVGLISLASSIPNVQVKNVIPVSQSDKLVHILIFAVLAYLLSGALRDRLASLRPYMQVATVVLMCAFVGFLDEAHQLLVVGRTFSLWDWLADIIGCVLGAMCYKRFHQN